MWGQRRGLREGQGQGGQQREGLGQTVVRAAHVPRLQEEAHERVRCEAVPFPAGGRPQVQQMVHSSYLHGDNSNHRVGFD